jgi:hypothetical protein
MKVRDLLIPLDERLIMRLQEKANELHMQGRILHPAKLMEFYLTYGLWNHDRVINIFLGDTQVGTQPGDMEEE